MRRAENFYAPSEECLRAVRRNSPPRAVQGSRDWGVVLHVYALIKEVVPHLTFSIGPPLFSREKERDDDHR